ncbi:PAS domain-containing hybrid sensor histidine kinase/response regulator [Alteromonadaceae bacterium BrNp21-10]|nr:PAS domain-containing hybrid sensor histidine kinase/response regulator [Alteromonadaceae bacterium BrNp21-10]
MALWLIIVSLIYVGVMFLIARWGDKPQANIQRITHHPLTYSLALGIYCTSWTYFGAVGTAVSDGWNFLPILLGPILLFIFAYSLLTKLVYVSKKQNINSIADLISCRYGKRQQTALIVTFIVTLAIIPYIALQLKAINASFEVFSSTPSDYADGSSVKALLATLLIAVFAILYGAKKADATEYRSGLMLAIASESMFKLLGLLVTTVIAFWLISQQPDITPLYQSMQAEHWSWRQFVSLDFFVQTLMAAAAFLCLPRQFHVMVVDNADAKNLKTARWIFPGYLLLTIATIIPIALASQWLLTDNSLNKDTFIMQLPLLAENHWAVVMVFIGGLSAATAMIIVATLTLSTMITNDVIMPLLLKRDAHQILGQRHYQHRVIAIRRVTIAAILLLAFGYYHFWTEHTALHSIGLIAFSLVIQLLPAIIGGLYWRKGHAYGVYAGLLSGFGCWLAFLLWPLITSNDIQQHTGIVSIGVIISLTANLICYLLFSLLTSERLIDKIQAAAFVNPNNPNLELDHHFGDSPARVKDLKDLLMTFLGEGRSEDLLSEYQQQRELVLDNSATLDQEFVRYCERMLAGALGSSSARSLVNIVLSGKQLDLEDVVNFFDDTTQALKTNQAILFNSLENLSQGISVVDRELNLVAWNRRYLELFDYPDGMVKIGQPISTLIRYNAERGECGRGDINTLVNKRLNHLRSGKKHSFIRSRSDGRVIEMVGNPLPNGGFVTSFNDITVYIETQKALKDSNIDLEENVKRRSAEISEITEELKQAKQEAEQANASKTRFLALASHDILQPLNAARLYLSSLSESDLSSPQQNTVGKVDLSLQATEELISTLLEISKLEQGALAPTLTHFRLADVLRPLCDELAAQCQEKGLILIEHWQDATLHCDPMYLRRILQNFISNAVKYTDAGRILVGTRKHQNAIRIEVWDSGAGIVESEQQRIFNDFYRLPSGDIKGVGLGLGVVQRMSQQLNCPIKVQSVPDKGSCFGVTVQLGREQLIPGTSQTVLGDFTQIEQCKVICIDDDHNNREAMAALLEKWHCQCQPFAGADDAMDFAQTNITETPDILLVDYQLLPSEINGVELIQRLQSIWQKAIPAALVTAVKDDDLKAQCQQLGIAYIAKPVKPAALKSWLMSQIQRAKKLG